MNPATSPAPACAHDRHDRPPAGPAVLRVAFVLPGLHRVPRGAEAAFESVADALARRGDFRVTLIGSGAPRAGTAYRFLQARCLPRERFERFPRLPLLRGDTVYEEASFVPGLLRVYRPHDYDVTVTCSYPFVNWALRARHSVGRRPAHVFVTENGDWAPQARNAEYAWFGCDGLITINPEFHARNHARWFTTLIPNGVDTTAFTPGPAERAAFALPPDRPIVLKVAALIESKRVLAAIDAVATVPDACLVVAGDGPLRDAVQQAAARRLPGRFARLTVPRSRMPDLYRCADALLHMSMEESFGNIYIEALATGLPVLAHDRPTTRWILGDQAWLGDTSDPATVGGALADTLAGRAPGSPAARRARAEQTFAWPIVAERYADFFRQVLARRALDV